MLFQVGPILLKCLDLNGKKPLLVALEISKRFIQSQDNFFRDHLQNVVPQCLKLCTFEESMVCQNHNYKSNLFPKNYSSHY